MLGEVRQQQQRRLAASTAWLTSEPNGNPSPRVASAAVRTAPSSVGERSASVGSPRIPGVAASVRSVSAAIPAGTRWMPARLPVLALASAGLAVHRPPGSRVGSGDLTGGRRCPPPPLPAPRGAGVPPGAGLPRAPRRASSRALSGGAAAGWGGRPPPPEALAVAPGPLEVVEQRPHEVPASPSRRPRSRRARRRGGREVLDAVVVVHPPSDDTSGYAAPFSVIMRSEVGSSRCSAASSRVSPRGRSPSPCRSSGRAGAGTRRRRSRSTGWRRSRRARRRSPAAVGVQCRT